MNGYLMLIFSTIVMSYDFCLDKQYQRMAGTSMRVGLNYNIIWGLVEAVIFFAINGFKLAITPFSIIMASIFALCVMAYKIIGLKILKKGGISLYTMFLMTGGMMVPYVYGLIVLNESFSLLQFIGLIVVLIAVVMAYYSAVTLSKKLLFLCVLVFFVNGITSVVTKVHQIETVMAVVSSMELLILTSILRSIFAAAAYPFAVKSDSEKSPLTIKSTSVIIASALICCISNMINFTYAKTVPATVLYPIITGGTILFSLIANKIIFKETATKKMVMAVVLCIIGLLLFL
ncbi:MAG: hypothetical protein IJN62_05560 [Clostridia bacterium]|nr:hypothetical protein [Clostridia bacterium]